MPRNITEIGRDSRPCRPIYMVSPRHAPRTLTHTSMDPLKRHDHPAYRASLDASHKVVSLGCGLAFLAGWAYVVVRLVS